MPLITYREALKNALAEEIERDENVLILGEEVAQYNGAYKITEGLWKKYGDKRLVDTPISEAGFIGMGIGASMLGLRPVIELMFWSFAYVAFDQIINNAGCVRYMSGGQVSVPMVIRTAGGSGRASAAQHSQSLHMPAVDSRPGRALRERNHDHAGAARLSSPHNWGRYGVVDGFL